MDDPEVMAIVAEYQALLNARLGLRESDAWYLESSLPRPVERIAAALQNAVMLGPEDYELGELGALYMELARFVPDHLHHLPPAHVLKLILKQRRTREQDLERLGSLRAGVGRPPGSDAAAEPMALPFWHVLGAALLGRRPTLVTGA